MYFDRSIYEYYGKKFESVNPSVHDINEFVLCLIAGEMLGASNIYNML
jgi:hypothetical protein